MNDPTPPPSPRDDADTADSLPGGSPSAEERNWALAAHLAGLLGYLVVVGSIVGPLVVWLVKKEESEFIADQALEALNFQITVFLLTVVCIVLALCVVGALLLIPLAVADLVFTIVAAMAASRGERYRYPFSLRLVK